MASTTPELLSEMMHDKSITPAVRLKAVETVLNRAFGRPVDVIKMQVTETKDLGDLDDIREEIDRLCADNNARIQGPTDAEAAMTQRIQEMDQELADKDKRIMELDAEIEDLKQQIGAKEE